MTERADCISIQGMATQKAGKNRIRMVPGKQQNEGRRTMEVILTKRKQQPCTSTVIYRQQGPLPTPPWFSVTSAF